MGVKMNSKSTTQSKSEIWHTICFKGKDLNIKKVK